MLKSMTAYAGSEKTMDDLTASVEIRSLNSKYLDIHLKFHHSLPELEERIKSQVSSRISRGRIEIKVSLKSVSDNVAGFTVDKAKAVAYHSALQTLSDRFRMKQEIDLELLLTAGNIIAPAEENRDIEKEWPVIESAVKESLDDIERMRVKEGAFLKKDFVKRLDWIDQKTDQVQAASKGLAAVYQERLKKRIESLTQGMVDIDPARIAQEAAFIADRSDISEEIVRAKSHVEQFHGIMDAGELAGRKLNFLLQELNREFNTMGSKAGNADIAHIIVEVKSELEKIREQVQNIE